MERHKLTSAEEREVVARYPTGATLMDLAREFDVSTRPITRVLRQAGIQRRPAHLRRGHAGDRTKTRLITPEQESDLAERYRTGALISEMAAELGVSHKAVNNALRRAGVRLRNRSEASYAVAARRRARGEHLNWKGGRQINADGYVLIWVDPADLLGTMSSGRHYVLEHRLIMARHLGRPLSTRETVHHKNGVRDDNRIENLELRQGRHGKHQAFVCANCGSHNVLAAELK